MSSMHAALAHSHGGTEGMALEEVARPEPGEGQVLIRVHAASVNPADWKMVQFGLAPVPFHLGLDLSGVVEALRPGVTELAVGDAVYGVGDFGSGTYAEYTVARPATLARKPSNLDHLQAAAVPLAAVSAWQALFDEGRLKAGQTVLIHGAAGGIGSFAVQLARWKQARIVGTASPANHALVRELGADEVIDYHAVRFEDVVREVDVVFDTVGGDLLERSLEVLKPGGVAVSMASMQPPVDQAAARGMRALTLMTKVNAAELAEIRTLIESGAVRPIIDSTFPLASFRDAIARSQMGHARGKIVLQIKD